MGECRDYPSPGGTFQDVTLGGHTFAHSYKYTHIQMRFGRTGKEKRNYYLNWTLWFAWHPVQIDQGQERGRYVWLEWVEWKHETGIGDIRPTFRLPE
jgi:hypothetical protein